MSRSHIVHDPAHKSRALRRGAPAVLLLTLYI